MVQFIPGQINRLQLHTSKRDLTKPTDLTKWLSLFKQASFHHLPAMGSDYCLILLKLVQPLGSDAKGSGSKSCG